MKKFTFILTSMLFLLVGGVFSQSVTTLYLDGGQNVLLSDKISTEGHVTSATVQFNQIGLNPGNAGLSGSNWIGDYNDGEIHTFTVTLKEAPGNNHFVIYGGKPKFGDFSNDINPGEENTYFKVSQEIASNATTATLKLTRAYDKVCIFNTTSSGETLKIESITRTITTASSVAAPTISPATGSTYDGDLSVTITKGEGNDRVVYSVNGSNEDVSNVEFTSAELTAGSKILSLTGTGPITVTATGYKGENASSEVMNTYTFDVPNRKKTITVSPSHTFNSWNQGNALQINQSEFSGMSLNDYVVLNVQDVAEDATFLGFRCNNNGWPESPFVGCTTVSRGNGAYGVINKGETLWWLKASNNYVVNEFTGRGVIMQGGMLDNNINSSVTLNSIDIYKSFTFSEGVDNTISSKENHVVVELTRSFTPNTWNTVCLPFVPTADQANTLFGEDYKLAAYTSVSGTTMHFTPITIDKFVAGKPYLVMPKTNCATGTTVLFDVNITAKNPTPVTFRNVDNDYYTFRGTFTTKTFTSADNTTSRFVAEGNELVTPSENSILKSLRCYFTVSATAPARSLSFDIDEEGGTTSINTVQGSGVMVNGYYNLAGQRVAQPTKGLYIVNGKKVVIK